MQVGAFGLFQCKVFAHAYDLHTTHMQTHAELFRNLNKIFLSFHLIPSWSGVYEETAEAVGGSQPADQHQRVEGRLHPAPPGLLAQPPGKRGGSGEQRSAPDTGPESQQSH